MAAVVFGFYFFRHLALQYQYHVVFDVAGETIEIQYQSNFQQWYNKTFFSKDRVYPFKEIKHFFQQQECFTRSHCHPYCFQIRTIFSNNYPLLMLRDEEAFVQVKAFLATHFAIRTSTDY